MEFRHILLVMDVRAARKTDYETRKEYNAFFHVISPFNVKSFYIHHRIGRKRTLIPIVEFAGYENALTSGLPHPGHASIEPNYHYS
jgi:hypothetical protein